MRAAVVEQPPQDVLMGRNCPELKKILKEALAIKQEVPVVTRQKTKQEEEEKRVRSDVKRSLGRRRLSFFTRV